MSEFKNMLKYLRERSGMSQQELAQKLGIAKSTIGMYESGKREPNFETMEAIADIFNVDMNFLHGIKEPENESYFLSDDARDLAQFLFDNPEYKSAFDAVRKIKKEDIQFIKEFVERVAGNN